MKQFIQLKKGYLLIESATDPNYPGVYVSYVENKDDVGQTLCLVEDAATDSENNTIDIHLWGDPSMDDVTETVSIIKSNWEGV